MPGIDPNIICHRLYVNPACKPVAQKRRNFAPERVAIIEAEIDKLLAAGFIEEVSYSEWLANVVLVAKQEKGKWRVCVDYTDLKSVPKRQLPIAKNRPTSGFHFWQSATQLHGRLLRLQPNLDARG
ncbi:unnamed protein product [Prunus armeniaca]